MRVIFFLLVGAIAGGIFFEWPGAIFGFLLGLLYSEFFNLKERVNKIESQFEPSLDSEAEEEVVADETPETFVSVKEVPAQIKEVVTLSHGVQEASATEKVKPPYKEVEQVKSTPAVSKITPITDALENTVGFIKTFFTTGNVVAKVGIIVLFFGVGFLLKFVAQRELVPIEARLFGVALGGLAILIVGWRMRAKRLMYGLILQGGGIGILYLTLFATAKHYVLMPILLAFVVMVGLVVLSAILAVLQNSKALAGFGVVGGFLAPVLMSTGSGNHVVLFSYYALLNAGILGIAWFRAWRELNLIGFIFTFVIGLLWGSQYYQPAYFASTEPFLVLFFLFYVVISVLFAHRQPFRLKGYVDSTLVFGTPIVAFGLQNGLVRDFEYGLAVSALILGVFYIGIASVLWRKNIEGMRMLTESFLALGVVFGSLAIPLALDGRWTASAWALEGAALVWVGLHQKRVLARNFGVFLQVGAAASFLMTLREPVGDIAVFNSFYLSCLLISLSTFFTSYMFQSFGEKLKDWEQYFQFILLAIGLLWWFGSGYHELDRYFSTIDLYSSLLVFISLSSFAISFASIKLQWHAMQFPSVGLLPGMVILLGAGYLVINDFHPFIRWGIVGWIIAFPIHYWHLFYFEKIWPRKIIKWWHPISLWLLVIVLTLEIGWLLDWFIRGSETWEFVAWGLVPCLFVLLLQGKGKELKWPVLAHSSDYLGTGLLPLISYVILWNLAACFFSGDPSPLPYLPILSPLDLVQLFSLYLIVRLAWLVHRGELIIKYIADTKIVVYLPAFIMFAWINALVARTVHFYGGVAFSLNALFSSIVFQAAISIVWTLAALFITFWATRKGLREVWFTGAALLSLVVIKLFVVDLASTGTIARIISFLVVGGLMLLIGYLSPLPSSQEEKVKS